jgi:chromosomal replication initiator protein
MNQLQEIIDKTEKHFGIPSGAIYDQCRTSTVVRARHIAAYLSRTTTKHSYPEISNHFHKHHTSIMNSVKRVKNNFKKYEEDIKNILPTRIIL